MITREIREWLDNVKRNAYSYDDAINQFYQFMPYLTKEEMNLLVQKIKESYM